MPLTWPAGLPQAPGLGWTESVGETNVRTPTDMGPAKVRQRFTSSVDRMTWPLALTAAQVATLHTFYKTTTAHGSLAFDITHPRTAASESVRFVGKPPSFGQRGGDMFVGSLTFEILP